METSRTDKLAVGTGKVPLGMFRLDAKQILHAARVQQIQCWIHKWM